VTSAQHPTLPVLATVAQAFSTLAGRAPQFAKLALVPAAITLASQIASGYLAAVLGAFWLNWAWYLPYAIIATPFAVAWTRLILLPSSDAPVSVVPRFGKRELTYLGISIVLAALGVVPALTTLVLLSSDRIGVAFGPMLVLVAVSVVVSIFVALRLSFALPAAAIDRFAGLVGAWRQTEGAALRIFAINFLVLVPILIVQLGASLFAALLGTELPALIIRAAIEVVFTFLLVGGVVVATALAYQRIVGEAAAPSY
jgi:hypothetical protein